MRTSQRLRSLAPLAVGTAFLLSGTVHLVRPATFRDLIPQALGAPDAWVYASGAAELICAYGLLTRRRWAGLASAALLIAVLPGNVQMALDASHGRGALAGRPVLAWARVPLQAPLIWAVLQARRPVMMGRSDLNADS
jgi:uncharacterized membrane protein